MLLACALAAVVAAAVTAHIIVTSYVEHIQWSGCLIGLKQDLCSTPLTGYRGKDADLVTDLACDGSCELQGF